MRLDINQLKQLDQRTKSGQMTSEDCRLLVALIESYNIELVSLLKAPDTSLDDPSTYLLSDKHDTATDGVPSDRTNSLRRLRRVQSTA